MFPWFDHDAEIRETDPIRKSILLVLCMAHQDGATALVLGVPQPDGSSTPIRYRVDGVWYDIPPIPTPIPKVATELERMAGLSETAREGVLEHTFAGVELRWRVQVTVPGVEYMLTPVANWLR